MICDEEPTALLPTEQNLSSWEGDSIPCCATYWRCEKNRNL